MGGEGGRGESSFRDLEENPGKEKLIPLFPSKFFPRKLQKTNPNSFQDDDPYVRKTAAICVAKLYDLAPDAVADRGFLDSLRDLLGDANPMVVANAVAALTEIGDGDPSSSSLASGSIDLAPAARAKLLRALNECTEWGQVFILDALGSGAPPADAADAEALAERVAPRLQHANCAVVLAAAKVLLRCAEVLPAPSAAALRRKLAPPLVTLLSAEPEVQYVALRNMQLIAAADSDAAATIASSSSSSEPSQPYQPTLAHEVRAFFCKYNDPSYVKLEKLYLVVALASEKTVDQVLLELREYSTEVDVEFARKAVRAVGALAVRLENAAERCVGVLLELVRTRVPYVVQEAVVVVRDVFRRYPGRYEAVISDLCSSLDSLDEPGARAAMAWIVGEYADRIDNADELLEAFLDSFPEEPSAVQLALVTAAVKLFLKKPGPNSQRLIQLVLTYATGEADDPDLRDRAFIYWRLLSSDPEAARDVVLAEKPTIASASSGGSGPSSSSSSSIDPELARALLPQMGSLASVYHRPAAAFVSKARPAVARAEDLAAARAEAEAAAASAAADGGDAGGSGGGPVPPPSAAAVVPDLLGDLLDLGDAPVAAPAAAAAAADDLLGDLGGLGLSGGGGAAAPAAPAPAGAAAAAAAAAAPFDPFGTAAPAGAPAAAAPASPPLRLVLPAEKGKGLSISAALLRSGAGAATYSLRLSNATAAPIDGLLIQFNKNAAGLAPVAPAIPLPAPAGLAAGAAGVAVDVPLSAGVAAQTDPSKGRLLQVAVRTNQLGVFYFDDAVPVGF